MTEFFSILYGPPEANRPPTHAVVSEKGEAAMSVSIEKNFRHISPT